MGNIPESALIERRALIVAVNQASAELHAAAREVSDDMGLVTDRAYIESHQRAYRAAEDALAEFYARYPLKQYRREFAAESKRARGWG